MRQMIWLMKMSKLARNPPSMGRVKFVLGIIAVCIVVYAVERFVGFPDWVTPNMVPRGRVSGP